METVLVGATGPMTGGLWLECPPASRASRGPAEASFADRMNFRSQGFGGHWPQFDLIGQAQHLQNNNQLCQATLPNALPCGFLQLTSYLNSLFPGTLVPTEPVDLEQVAHSLRADSATGEINRLDLYDLVESLHQTEECQGETQLPSLPEPDTTLMMPIFVNAFSYQAEHGKVQVANIEVGRSGDGLPANSVGDGRPCDMTSLSFLGSQGMAYDVAVTWEDGTSTIDMCQGEGAAGMTFDVYVPW